MFKDPGIPTGIDHNWARLRHWETLLSKDPGSWDFHSPFLFTNHSLKTALQRWIKPAVGPRFIAERHNLDTENSNATIELVCHIDDPPLTPRKTRFMGRYLYLKSVFSDSVNIPQSNNEYKSQNVKVNLERTEPPLSRIYLPGSEGYFQAKSASVIPLFYLHPNSNTVAGENRNYIVFNLGLTRVS